MIVLFLLLPLVSSNLFSYNPFENCGIPNRNVNEAIRRGRIIGGDYINAHDLPWIVRVDYYNQGDGTGSLISDRHVLTAGHVVVKKGRTPDTGEFSVCHGTSDMFEECSGNGIDSYKVKNIYFTEQYQRDEKNGSAPLHDFVVLELDRPVPDVMPICLPFPSNYLGYKTNSFVDLYATGYGNNNDEQYSRLRNTKLRHGNASKRVPCDDGRQLPSLCTEFTDKKAAICAGDSGGPLSEIHDGRYFLVGINVESPADGCHFNYTDTNGRPRTQVSTEVAYYLWDILAVLKNDNALDVFDI